MTQKERPRKDWIVQHRENLRIISKDLEEKVLKRKQERSLVSRVEKGTFGGGNTPKQLFIGTMKCELCGGNFVQVSGKSGGYVGCKNANIETLVSCSNTQTIRMDFVEAHLIDELKKNIDREQTYSYLADKYNSLMKRKHGMVPARLIQLEKIIQEKESVLFNFMRFIASGNCSETVSKGIGQVETSLNGLKTEYEYLKGQTQSRVYVTPQAIRERMGRLDELLGLKKVEANRVLKKIFPEKITMSPSKEKKREYIASGVISLYELIKF